MVFDPLRSKHQIVRDITDYQIQVLMLLHLGCTLLCTEGSSYRVWLEDPTRQKVSFTLRKDTVNNLHGLGLLAHKPDTRFSVFAYSLSQKGTDILTMLKDDRKRPNELKLSKVRIEQQHLGKVRN